MMNILFPDKNYDGILVEEEFVTLPLGEVDDEYFVPR